MRKDTKQAFRALLDATKQALNDTETPEIADLMPEYGKKLWTEEKDCDENGNWFFVNHYFDRSEDEAIYEAQYNLLNGCANGEDALLDEFFCESSLRPLMVEFMRCVAKEAVKC